ncbi:MAG: CPBP family intramembrane metalloprotease [Clostridia bacterium]|nr:CPBP family intramembrane metalloprotease [Clostridia bacterium]
MKMLKIKRSVCLIVTAVAVAVLIVLEILKPAPFGIATLDESFLTTLTRMIGGAVFLIVTLYLGYDVLNPKYVFTKRFLLILPCLVVAVNNLPSVALLRADAKVTGSAAEIAFFAVECVFVAIFEELAFRSALFLSMLKNRRSRKGIFTSILISSALFGLFHMVNLIYGASLGSVILQVGYSTLVGCMCAFVLFKTHSVWLAALVHAVYNFCGHIVPRLGEGKMLNAPQIIITVIISLFCAIYIIISLIKIDISEADSLFPKNSRSNK